MSPLGDSLYTPHNLPAEPVRKILGKVSLQGGPLGCSERTAAMKVDVRESSRELVAGSPEGAASQDGDVGFVQQTITQRCVVPDSAHGKLIAQW